MRDGGEDRTPPAPGWRAPLRAALLALGWALLLLLPILAATGFDPAILIGAGEVFANRAALAPPIPVTPDSLGYDGQFFYRLALDPFLLDPAAHGIAFDEPAKRMGRILYPLAAHALAFGQAALVPAALLGVNLAAFAALAALAARVRQHRGLAWWFPAAVVLWPGFVVTLTRDTAEIPAAALLLAALACHLSGRMAAYAALGALAALTRETTVPALAGLLAWEAWRFLRARPADRAPVRLLLAALPVGVFGAWWVGLGLAWGAAPQAVGGNPDLGWPFAGTIERLAIDAARLWAGKGAAANLLFGLATVAGLMGFAALVLSRLGPLARSGRAPGLGAAWLPGFALMTLLTAGGPLVEPLSYMRAFTECWLVGCLVLAHGQVRLAYGFRVLLLGVVLFGATLVTWRWSFELLLLAT